MAYRIFTTSATYASGISLTDYNGAYIASGVVLGFEDGGLSAIDGINVIVDGGSIISSGTAIHGYDGSTFTIEAGSLVRSLEYLALYLGGTNTTLKNAGTVISDASLIFAVDFHQDNVSDVSTFTNSGVLRSTNAYALNHGQGMLTLNNSGTIEGKLGIFYTGSTNGIERITNTGKLIGKVELRTGDDTLDTTKGTVDGTIDMGDGKDVVYGSAFADSIAGGAERDLIRGNAGKDSLDGGTGADRLDYTEKTVGVQLTLNGSTTSAVLVGGIAEDTIKNFEYVYGGKAADKLIGDGLTNDLRGFNGNDTLSGSAGNDFLFGGNGSDALYGGANNDSFYFDTALGASNIDSIRDFSHVSDTVRLDNAIFTALGATSGAMSSAMFKSVASGHAATNTSQHVIYDRSTGELWYDPTGSTNGATDAVQFARLTTKPVDVDYTDFSIV